jgi:hypothetical protein
MSTAIEGAAPPSPPAGAAGAGTIVIWAAHASAVHGAWQRETDQGAAGGAALRNPDRGQSKIAPALASPSAWWETTFTAAAGVPYHLWARLRADGDAFGNDSVHVQFSDAVTVAGQPTARIGSTGSAELVLQDGPSGPADSGWGWTDNGWGVPGAPIYFAAAGTHTIRVQQREDGASIDQIVLSPDAYLTAAPGARANDTTVLAETTRPADPDIVLRAGDVRASWMHGAWQRLNDSGASGGAALWNPDAGRPRVKPALASPSDYWETTFTARAGVAYHLWMRLAAQGGSFSNDSVHVQFDDAVDASGAPSLRIGTADSAEIVLQNGPGGAANPDWGWADNGWGAPGAPIRFASTGRHTLRVQAREDGAIVDEVVLSPADHLTSAPGARVMDGTMLTATDGPLLNVVLRAADVDAALLHGAWQIITDATASAGSALWNPNRGAAKIAPARGMPVNYWETTFSVVPNTGYRVWVRLRAEHDAFANDSVHLQFDDAVDASGRPMARIGTTQSAEVVLQDGPHGAADSGWGWADNGWGAPGALIYFATPGPHTIRIQQREDGAVVDEIVLSPEEFLTAPPGPRAGDLTVLAPHGS